MVGIPQAGLVGYWPLDEGEGEQVRDEGPNGHAGRVAGARWRGDGALYFGGDRSSIEIENHATLELEQDITIAAWIRKDRPNDGERWDAILSKSPGIWDYELLTSMANSDEPAFYGRDTEPNEVYAGEPAPAGRWTHVAVSRTGERVTFYLDAAERLTSTQSGTFVRSGGRLQIGFDGAERNGGMLGCIAGVALYSRGLGAAEVTALSEATRRPIM
jgi:hypothetical protein